MYDNTDMRFASAYHHWFHLIQPTARDHDRRQPALLPALEAGRLGRHRRATSRPSRARPSTNTASAAPRPSTRCARDYRAAAIDLEHDRASRAAGQKIACDALVLWGERGVVRAMFEPLALWRLQCNAAGERPRAQLPATSSPRSAPRKPPRRCSTSSPDTPTTLDEDRPPCSPGCSGSTSISRCATAPGCRLRRGHDAGGLLLGRVRPRRPARAGVPRAHAGGACATRQALHAVLRNYPVIGHLRFLLEYIRPEMRQYFIEGRQRGRALLAPAALAGLPARQGRLRQAPFGTQMDVTRSATSGSTIRCSPASSPARLPRHHRRGPRPALRRERVQHLGDELRRALGQRRAGAQRGRTARRLRARHRRGLDQPPPPRQRRRPDLGDRLGLLRLPHGDGSFSESASSRTRACRR